MAEVSRSQVNQIGQAKDALCLKRVYMPAEALWGSPYRSRTLAFELKNGGV